MDDTVPAGQHNREGVPLREYPAVCQRAHAAYAKLYHAAPNPTPYTTAMLWLGRKDGTSMLMSARSTRVCICVRSLSFPTVTPLCITRQVWGLPCQNASLLTW